MSSKQKIALSAIGIVLVLAIVGLTIGLVLVASQAQTTNTMKITYNATNVQCTITASGNNGMTVEGKASKTIEVDAKATTTAAGTVAFDDVEFNDATKVYVYTFAITNTGAEGSSAIVASFDMDKSVANPVNMEAVATQSMVDEDGEVLETQEIAVGETAYLTVTVSVKEATLAASFEGSYVLVVEQA